MSAFRTALVTLVALALSPAPGRAFTPITVTVRERDGFEHRHWPLTVSVPFAPGELQPGAAVQVVDEGGASLPVQSRPLVRWHDGSVRWLLLDTQVDLRPRHARRLRVQSGHAAAAAGALQISEDGEGIRIDTGVLRFLIPKQRFAIVEALRLRGSEDPLTGALGALLIAGERSGQAQPPTRVALIDSGPLRARVALQGTYGNGFDYEVRIEAYAGQPFVRVWHTFIDRHPTPYISLPRVGVELPLVGAALPSRYRYGVVGERPVTGRLADEGARLYQSDNETFVAGEPSKPGKLSGWIELSGERASIGVAARWLWEQYPQSFAVRRDRLVYNLWAPEADPAKSGVGAAKTHEFVLWASPPAAALPPALLGAVARPLVGVVDPLRLAHSGALPQSLAPQGPAAGFVRKAVEGAHRYFQRNAIEPWNDCGAVRCDESGLARVRTGAFGMWNWGDWNFRGYQDTTKGTDSWGNLEYDTAYVLALTYASSGDAEVYDQMVAAARHFTDVDTIHACPTHPDFVGMNHPKNPLHFSFELGGPDLGHTWTQGSLAYYYLTGDERALAAARGVADYLVERAHRVVNGNPRQWGWPQIALMAVYDATGERRYLDAAVAYAQGGMRAHPPTGSAQWKLGILADALAYVHAATGDPAMRAWLEWYAGAVMTRKAREDVRAFPAIAYVAALTGNAAMRDAVRARADRLDLGSWGKPYSINGRIGFRIESLLAAAPPHPPPARHK
jgi:hypothetical protein